MQSSIWKVVSLLTLAGCGVNETSVGICEGLQEPIDTFAETLLGEHKETPAPVIITGTRVIKGFDAGCGGP